MKQKKKLPKRHKIAKPTAWRQYSLLKKYLNPANHEVEVKELIKELNL